MSSLLSMYNERNRNGEEYLVIRMPEAADRVCVFIRPCQLITPLTITGTIWRSKYLHAPLNLCPRYGVKDRGASTFMGCFSWDIMWWRILFQHFLHILKYLVQVWLGTEVPQAPQVRGDQGSNSWPPDHDSIFACHWDACSSHLAISDFYRVTWCGRLYSFRRLRRNLREIDCEKCRYINFWNLCAW